MTFSGNDYTCCATGRISNIRCTPPYMCDDVADVLYVDVGCGWEDEEGYMILICCSDIVDMYVDNR